MLKQGEFHGVRYQVTDVSRAVTFYVEQLGFKLENCPGLVAFLHR